MKRTIAIAAAVLCAVATFGSAGAVAQTKPQACNRECLKGHLDTYLNAVVTHKPEAANLWAGFRQTENALAIPEGHGVWKNVTALGGIQRQYFDPVLGQAGYFGTVKIGDEEAAAALRLKVQWNQVTEAEWFIARKSDAGMTGEAAKTPFNLDTLRATLPPQRVVPKGERLPREVLESIVNTYFDGITNKNGLLVKGHVGCSRYENGFPTFNTPMTPTMDIGNDGKTDCRTQADFGVAIVAARNYFVIDEEAQTVMMSALFRRESKNPKRRNHFTELFHIDGGKIRSVHATFHYAPDDRPLPNWPPYDGMFPLPSGYH
jgi:hypothetical protein